MTEAQIKHMVNRFLSWKLPDNFNPDAGISFKARADWHKSIRRNAGRDDGSLHDRWHGASSGMPELSRN